MSDRPTTYVIEGRADIRSIATLARYFIEQGNAPRSKSELVRFIIETFSDILVDNGITERFRSTQRAKAYMDRIAMGPSRDDKLYNSLLQQIQKETLQDEGFTPHKPRGTGMEDEAMEAVRIFQKKNPVKHQESKGKEAQGIAGPIPAEEDKKEQDG